MIIRVSKVFNLEMAHALQGYDGQCKNIHGHSYKFTVCLIGNPQETNSPKNGMVMDFSDLKKVVKEFIIDAFDHSLVLNENYSSILPDDEAFSKVHKFKLQPTCENILAEFHDRLSNYSFGQAKLYSMKLQETDSSFAEWFSSDQ